MNDRCIVVAVVHPGAMVQAVNKDMGVAVVRYLSLQHGITVDQ